MIDYSKQAGKKFYVNGNQMKLHNLDDIMYIKSENGCSTFFLSTGTVVTAHQPLCKLEKELLEMGFFKIRANIIINGKYIIEVNTKIRFRTVTLEKASFLIAKNRIKAFIEWIS